MKVAEIILKPNSTVWFEFFKTKLQNKTGLKILSLKAKLVTLHGYIGGFKIHNQFVQMVVFLNFILQIKQRSITMISDIDELSIYESPWRNSE